MPKTRKSTSIKTRKPSTSKSADPQQKEWVNITLRTDKGYSITFPSNEKLEQVAMKWRAVVRNRNLWTGNMEKREERAKFALEDVKDALMQNHDKYARLAGLKENLQVLENKPGEAKTKEEAKKETEVEIAILEAEIGEVVEGVIAELAKARIIEVSIPYKRERVGWEARILPWEYLITAATSSRRQGQALTIIRHLDCGKAVTKRKPSILLTVESALGNDTALNSISAEGKLMEQIMASGRNGTKGTPAIKGERCLDQVPEKVRSEIQSKGPDIIHLAGMDTHQGFSLKLWAPPGSGPAPSDDDDEEDSEEISASSRRGLRDGFLMSGGEGGQVEVVSPARLAKILNAGKAAGKPKPPILVACNIYHSAARIGPMIVAGGAHAAIGFQDEFDDALAELFFGHFYHAWRVSKWDLLTAFVMACQALRAQPRGLSGTGVVLWTATSFLKASVDKKQEFDLANFTEIKSKIRKEKEKTIQPDDTKWGKDEASARDLLPVEIEARTTVNYSMLHNERPLFRKFLIHKIDVRSVNRVEIDVGLQVGDQKAEYSASCDVVDSPLDLRDRIRLPLLSKAWAEMGESARTTLSVRLRWGNHELYRQTHPVTLLTLDEWRDDDVNTAWLPSFVLPRDPAVRRIIESGQRYLMSLRDDPFAGFDGYQSLILESDDPEEIAEDLDYQVRAIWSAIVYDHAVSYTNPPPSFTERSQRLRSPSEIFEAKRATCIDTTLLLASCLELIEVYPVLFLLTGHAFVGYWRSDTYRQEFMEQMAKFGSNTTIKNWEESEAYKPTYAWYFERRFYDIVLKYIREAKLVPLESTLLTTRGSFGDAIAQGLDNLRNRSEFHSMLDVITARENRVTPIPMRGK